MNDSKSAHIKLCIKNTTPFRTDSATPKALDRGDYAAIDRSMMKDTSISFAARALFVLMLCLGIDENPSQKELARLTKHGPAKIGRLLKELEGAGWIARSRMPIDGASCTRIDVFGPSFPADESVPDGIDSHTSQFQMESTHDQVGSKQNQPEESNPLPASDTMPLIEQRKKYNESEERKGEPSLSLVSRGDFVPKEKPKPLANWVRIAKLIEESFNFDGDFTFGVLNPFVKGMAEAGDERKVLIFSEWLDHYRDERNGGKRIHPSKRNLGLLWNQFVAGGCQPRLPEAAYA